MKLADYIANENIAIATEIYNAKLNSIDDALKLMETIGSEANLFCDIISDFSYELYEIEVAEWNIAKTGTELNRMIEFKNSDIAKLIERFIISGDEYILDHIKREIEASNPFDIQIRPDYATARANAGHELFCYPTKAHFMIGYTNKFYEFDNWDIDKDISDWGVMLAKHSNELSKHIAEKEKMLALHGDCLLAIPADSNYYGDRYDWC